MRIPSAGLFYVFCDEKYLTRHGNRQILTSYVAVPQGPWKSLPLADQLLQEPKKMLRLDRIETLLEHTDGVALVALVELTPEMTPKRELDGTIDLPEMSRGDNVWGASMALGLAALFPLMHNLGLQVKTADVYYDNRVLKNEHALKMEQLVTKLLPKQIRMASRAIQTTQKAHLTIRRFEKIVKVPEGREPDRFQTGITVAHYLLKDWMYLSNQPRRRIQVWDNTARQ